MTKLIGGPGDGKEMGEIKVPRLQWTTSISEKPLFYDRLNLISLWPVRGWELMCVDTGDLSRGDENRYMVAWRKRAWFSTDRQDEVHRFLKSFHWMDDALLAYSHRDGTMIDFLLPKARAEAERWAEITNPQERTDPDGQG